LIHIKRIRNAGRRDLGAVTEIDSLITRVRKPKYWAEALRRYGGRGRGRFFLVAETKAGVRGYIVGEVRDWAFGEPPCGWVFEMGVHPRARLAGLGTRLLEALCARLQAFRPETPRLGRHKPDLIRCENFESSSRNLDWTAMTAARRSSRGRCATRAWR